jgi:O-antigen/teichoic acid export membrane protein
MVEAASGPPGHLLQTTGRHVPLLKITAIAAVVNLALSVTLVGPLGSMGVAFAHAAGLVLLSVLTVGTVRRQDGILTLAYPAASEWLGVARLAIGRGRRLPEGSARL